MTLKHWTLVGGAVACLAAGNLAAAPWIPTGDVATRHRLEIAADTGQLDRSITTWPIMKQSIDAPTESGWKRHINVRAASENPFVQGFASEPGEYGELGLALGYDDAQFAVSLNSSFSIDPSDKDTVRLDGSYLVGKLGNWLIGAGAIDRWWGPGWQSSLILSDNARPAPGIWLNRQNESPFETPLLSWIGPWQLTAVVSQLEEERAVSNPLWIGFRGTFRPLAGLDIGLSRIFMFGGEGRDSSLATFWDAFRGNDNPRDSESDPSNQLGAIDVRYGFSAGEQTLGLYAQLMGEDEAGGFPAKKAWLLGLDGTSGLWGRQQRWFLEGTDTIAEDLFGDPIYDITYEHRVYRTGYRYKGRNMAASIDADSRMVTLGYFDFFAGGRVVGANVSWLSLKANPDSRVVVPDPSIRYFVPAKDQIARVFKCFIEQPFGQGRLRLSAGWMDDQVEIRSGQLDSWSVTAGWNHSF